MLGSFGNKVINRRFNNILYKNILRKYKVKIEKFMRVLYKKNDWGIYREKIRKGNMN